MRGSSARRASVKIVMSESRILVVDDEPQFLATVQCFLEGNGFEVLAGNSCRQAEDIYTSARPDAAVLDYSLPDGNILDVLPRLRAIDASIPIIIMTGHASIELAVQAIKHGAEHFLTKPVDLSALAVMLKRGQDNVRMHRNRCSIRADPAVRP